MEPSGMRIPEDASLQYEYISPIAYSKSSRCGYCGKRGNSYSYYASASSMSPGFYQTLLGRCWRRSGTLMYRPDQRRSCCPHYTIRLDSSQFKPSRDQRQTINRFNRYVMGETYTKEVARLHPKSRDQAKKRDNHFDLIERVHEAEDAQLLKPPEAAHKLVVTLEPDDFTEEKYEVYENYQRVVHKEGPSKITAGGFKRFLCSSPLRRETMVDSNGKERRLGSYHQCYRLDGKLVAIGVLDLLPECVSSVYFLYHESIHKWAPGKLGALYEIALSIEEGYGWWYPGFYIHSCPKMRYKIDYSPQFILDPNSLAWDPLDRKMLDLLDKKPFVSLSLEKQRESNGNGDGPSSTDEDVEMSNKSDAESEDSKSGDDEDDWLFKTNMPGIPPLSSVADWDLDNIALKIKPDGPLYKTSNLVIWDKRGVEDYPGLKAGVAELVAAIGPDLIDRICLDFTPRGG
ncbi:Arginyl-tRNA--protein transferase 1, variant 2 [Fusarium falciforme]|uniref:arginyltransferase n=2 Tax=Fusarium falciforme TaxID=195108 RepID=A0A9W8RBS3_9HYPO|nr:Arginyl-tRNA--protein transferase 1, variant 2 [Fusarium falciforme]